MTAPLWKCRVWKVHHAYEQLGCGAMMAVFQWQIKSGRVATPAKKCKVRGGSPFLQKNKARCWLCSAFWMNVTPKHGEHDRKPKDTQGNAFNTCWTSVTNKSQRLKILSCPPRSAFMFGRTRLESQALKQPLKPSTPSIHKSKWYVVSMPTTVGVMFVDLRHFPNIGESVGTAITLNEKG